MRPGGRPRAGTRRRFAALAVLVALWSGCQPTADFSALGSEPAPGPPGAGDWPGYGRDGSQRHFSPLSQVNASTVGSLGLAWSLDLPPANSNTQPIAVDGVLYFASGLSVVHAVDASSGELLWRHDPGVAERAGLNLRIGWGVRGLAWWRGRLFAGTQDGRLLAIDAANGEELWSVQTFPPEDSSHISGAPRAFDGRVFIGFGGSAAASRGYVTAYDALTGRKLWRFFTTPGNPALGFENEAMARAAETWAGEWWKYGGGGHVWNAMAYDRETRTLFIGTGSPYPWNRRARSEDRGDNWFVCSIVALDAETGDYRWHYQTVPGDTWDFDAAMDIELAELEIDGRLRKVVMQAPKNGFFYVLDRETGELISAEAHVPTTWASHIDPRTGRPVELPGVRYPDGSAAKISPTGLGAHNWMSMAYSPLTRLVYLPAIESSAIYRDGDLDWPAAGDRLPADATLVMELSGENPTGRLVAWSPAEQRAVWQVEHPTYLNGGTLATAGNLVFQGTIDGIFRAYAADTGESLWEFDARAPILAAPISYRAGGRQLVSLLVGTGMGFSSNAGVLLGERADRVGLDPRTQARRVLTFALGGTATLPDRPARAAAPPPDPGFELDPERARRGALDYAMRCGLCHGSLVVGSVHAPDLRRSAIPVSREAFLQVVRDGSLTSLGMPGFPEFSDQRLDDVRHYIRAQAARLRASQTFD